MDSLYIKATISCPFIQLNYMTTTLEKSGNIVKRSSHCNKTKLGFKTMITILGVLSERPTLFSQQMLYNNVRGFSRG